MVAREFTWQRGTFLSCNIKFGQSNPSHLFSGHEGAHRLRHGSHRREGCLPHCEQVVETRVSGSKGQSFRLGRVLPGQRDGSLLWYRDLAKHVRQGPLEMKELDA